MATHRDVGVDGHGIAGGTPVIGNGFNISAAARGSSVVHPEHDLVGVAAIPYIVGRLPCAAAGSGGAETGFKGVGSAEFFADVFRAVGIGLDAARVGMIGPDTPITVAVGPNRLRTGAGAPDIVVERVAAICPSAPLGRGGPSRRLGGGSGGENNHQDSSKGCCECTEFERVVHGIRGALCVVGDAGYYGPITESGVIGDRSCRGVCAKG